MSESMDIAFLLVTMSPMNSVPSDVTNMISSVISSILKNNCDIHLALVKYISDNDIRVPTVHPFTTSVSTFRNWLTTSDAPVQQHSHKGTIEILDSLRIALGLDWRTTSDDRCHEKIVFLITDGFPCQKFVNPKIIENDDNLCACNDLWVISDEFVKQKMTIVIVGFGSIVAICDGFYGSIATNTGGEYIPITNASNILCSSIQTILTQGDTLSQSLRHIKREEFERNSSYRHSIVQNKDQSEIKHSQIMAQQGAWLLDDLTRANL
ncbi:unnamed protein product [Rotaria magnacalcarata]|uniref:VWFA domain-containing protein n=3 Tax=Rotaria magnacalcarata TaxID=392030 RepID=A0A816M3E8_9BILA|nr:unnamed protein product [Rotaria magnacalcarata]CAF1666444.1 unnamed protein product [Rotaria magnacalcarata]CAF1972561.1 unnamed protein product [Rotaria magnacalcarata]CAF3836349.1 unnamed protein product [Rotaria magnacalcarata]